MSTSLPQEVQTSKVTTLPDDLKAIAEAMLGEKFGVKEVTEEFTQDPFPKEYPGCTCGPQYAIRCAIHEPNVGSGYGGIRDLEVHTRVDYQRQTRVAQVALHYADTRVLHDAINKLQREFGSHNRMYLVASHRFLKQLASERGFREFFEHREERGGRYMTIGRIFGCEVVHPSDVDGEITRIQMEF